MKRSSAVIVAAGLVFALMAGTVSRVLTLHQIPKASPIQIVVQTPPSQTTTPSGFVEKD